MSIANQLWKYKNFSGFVRWNGTNLFVRNADFTLNIGCISILFYDAVFVEGICSHSHIHNALNLNCYLTNCNINYLINKGGEIDSSNWKDGIFDGGKFIESIWRKGYWKGGTWISGYDKDINPRSTDPSKW